MSLILKMLIVVDCSILEKFLCLVEKEEGKKKKILFRVDKNKGRFVALAGKRRS